MEQINKIRSDTMQRSHSNALDSQRFQVDCHGAGSLHKAKKIVDDALLRYQCVDIKLPLGSRPVVVGEEGEGVPVVEDVNMEKAICDYLNELGVDYTVDDNVAGCIEIRRVTRIPPALITDVAQMTLEQAKEVVVETAHKFPERDLRLLTGIVPSRQMKDVSNHLAVKLEEWLKDIGASPSQDPSHPGALIVKAEEVN
ncbi:hypothetical protein E3P77_00056 [Wallemia ichthyophaga]|nr:hypothetical protein E3P77_00056 [Wallemia ichthyophaga]